MYDLKSFADAFNESNIQGYRLYSFILATSADIKIFPDLIKYFEEIHEWTGKDILVFRPYVVAYCDDVLYANDMANGHLKNYIKDNLHFLDKQDFETIKESQKDLESHFLSMKDMDKFLKKQNVETIKFAQYCGLNPDIVPCMLFFESLEDPSSYLVWQLHDQTAESVVKDFRSIVTRVRNQPNNDALGIISDLDRERYIYRTIERLGRIVPFLAGALAFLNGK